MSWTNLVLYANYSCRGEGKGHQLIIKPLLWFSLIHRLSVSQRIIIWSLASWFRALLNHLRPVVLQGCIWELSLLFWASGMLHDTVCLTGYSDVTVENTSVAYVCAGTHIGQCKGATYLCKRSSWKSQRPLQAWNRYCTILYVMHITTPLSNQLSSWEL